VVDACYRFLSDAIRRQPEHWWAADLLPAMPPVVPKPPPEPLREAPFEAQYDVVIADAGPLAATEEFAAGMRQLRQRIAAPRWWHACTGGALTPAQLLRYSPAELFLAIPEPALVASDNLVAELDAVCRQHAADCVLPADPRCSDGLAIDYVTRQAFDRYVARRAALAAAAPYDGRSPWLYLVRRAAVQAAVDADPAVSWAALPAAAPVRSVTANRAFVHWYGDYQRHDRAEVLDLLPGQVAELLDVGGGEGRFAAAFVERTGGRAAVAELNPAAAAVAAARGLEVHAGPFEGYARRLSFDCVCFLDVLEHLPDPLAALRKARALLKPGGYVLLVVPNVGHWSVVGELLGGDFTYLPAGILCATHLRFFTRRSLEALLREAGFEVVRWRDHPGPPPAAFLERLAAGSGADMESLATDSFHVLARKS
jgi:SAM-dependent methyltransferase